MKVSVCITSYNHDRYIAQALESVLMQETSFTYEIVVGDDCSADRTREIIIDYQRRFPGRIRTIFPGRNLGDGGRPMFVEIVRACGGEFIAMLDGDDYWTAPNKLQRQVEHLEAHPECSMSYHNALIVYEDGSSRQPEHLNPPNHPAFLTSEDLLWRCSVPSCSAMIRKEVVVEFPAWYFRPIWGDFPMYLLASERGPIAYINAVMGVWRHHGGGIWTSLDAVDRIEGFIQMLNNIDEGLRQKYRLTLSAALAFQNFNLARVHAKRGDIPKATRAIFASIRHDPRGSGILWRDLIRARIIRSSVRK
jgi:glycosyltransferase involved in cell wall biosynthesis